MAICEMWPTANLGQLFNQPARGSVAMTVHWNACAFLKGNYLVSAVAWHIRCEVDVSDRDFVGG